MKMTDHVRRGSKFGAGPSSARVSRPRTFGAGLPTPHVRRGSPDPAAARPEVSGARETFGRRCGSVGDRPQHARSETGHNTLGRRPATTRSVGDRPQHARSETGHNTKETGHNTFGAGLPTPHVRRGSPDPARSARVSRPRTFGAGLPTPPRPDRRSPGLGRPSVGDVARSETGHNTKARSETGHNTKARSETGHNTKETGHSTKFLDPSGRAKSTSE